MFCCFKNSNIINIVKLYLANIILHLLQIQDTYMRKIKMYISGYLLLHICIINEMINFEKSEYNS